jgi:hypothetical protein
MQVVGASRQFEGEVTETDFGVAEEGGVAGGDELSGHLQEEIVAAVAEDIGEVTGQSFLGVGEGLRHGVVLATWKVDYSSKRNLGLKCTDFLPTVERPTPASRNREFSLYGSRRTLIK